MLDSVPDNYQFITKTNTGVSNSVSGGPGQSLVSNLLQQTM